MKYKGNSEDEELITKRFALGKEYQAVELLGEGTYGSVYKVRKKGDSKFYAIKKIKNKSDNYNEGVPYRIINEIGILNKVKHPNVVKIERISLEKNDIEICFEYCKYDLRKIIDSKMNDNSFYNVNFVKNMMYQLLKGVAHLHSNFIFLRDLKPQNILVDENGWILKLADFGLSRVYSIPIRPYSKGVFTIWYAAPELLLGKNIYATEIDIWSIGCIFIELYLGRPFVMGDSEIDQFCELLRIYGTVNALSLPVYKKAKSEELPNLPFWKGIGLQDYLNEKNQIIKIDGLAFDLMEKMLAFDPCERITCKEALNHPYFNGVVCTCNYSN